VCAVAVSRFVFRSHYLYDIDSVNYALALDRFDPTVHQPHPPGYFLYVYLGRLARLIFHDSNTALVALSIVASCAAAVMIYVLAANWFGSRAARFAGLIFLFSPLCWFHGTVALTYILEAFFSAVVGYLCWRTYSGDNRSLAMSAIALGIAVGCRQSSVLFLGPLWLLSQPRVPKRQIWYGLLVLAVTLLAWVAPMLWASGGAGKYFASLFALWRIAPSRATVLNSSIFMSMARFCTIGGIAGLCFGSASLLFFRPRNESTVTTEVDRDRKLFTWVWIGPGLLFFTFVFLKYVNSGYLLVLSPPVFAWLGARAANWYSQDPGDGYVRKRVLVGALAAANVAGFVYAPIYCSYKSVREAESELIRVRDALQLMAAPNDTLIVGFDSHFLGYRHAGYYLPRFLTVQFPELSYPEGKRVFALQGGDTRLLERLPLDRYRKFVLFPLPGGTGYYEYFKEVRRRFPEGTLTATVVEGHEFLTGSTADLPFLFPTVAPTQAQLYTQNHSSE